MQSMSERIKVVRSYKNLDRLIEIESKALKKFEEAGYLNANKWGVRQAEDYDTYFENERLFVATDEAGTALGFALCDIHEHNLHLEEIDVDPSSFRNGIGTQLLNEVIKYAIDNKCKYITLRTFADAPWSLNLYRRAGFRQIKDDQFSYLPNLRDIESNSNLPMSERISMSFKVKGEDSSFSHSWDGLHLKAITDTHEDFLRDCILDTEVTQWTGFNGITKDYRFQSLFIRWRYLDIFPFGEWVVEDDRGASVGWAMLKNTNAPNPELGYLVAKSHWGQGVGYRIACLIEDYAFNCLGLGAIYAQTCTANVASVKILRKLGMRLTEESKDMMYFDKEAK